MEKNILSTAVSLEVSIFNVIQKWVFDGRILPEWDEIDCGKESLFVWINENRLQVHVWNESERSSYSITMQCAQCSKRERERESVKIQYRKRENQFDDLCFNAYIFI